MDKRAARRLSMGAFTLIEILIVITIIIIIAAIAIPNLLNGIQRGKQKRTMGELRTLGTAVDQYTIDFGRPPTVTDMAGLEQVLAPTYLQRPPTVDGWGHDISVYSDRDGYIIVSVGQDGRPSGIPADDVEADRDVDRVYANGRFLTWPVIAGRRDDPPLFPWPVPPWSAAMAIRRELLVAPGQSATLDDIADRLERALMAAGYGDLSYLEVPGGFALASQLERFEPPRAEPARGEHRWTTGSRVLRRVSLAEYIAALFSAQPGHFRVVVFVVTPFDLAPDPKKSPPEREQAQGWVSGGVPRLPPTVSSWLFSPAHACTALVYEFERPTRDEQPRPRVPGMYPAEVHLKGSGLLARLEGQP